LPVRIAPDKTALLVIDMQRGLLADSLPTSIPAGRKIIHRLARLIEDARRRGLLIVYTRMSHDFIGKGPYGKLWPSHFKEDGQPILRRGSDVFEITPELIVQPGDVVIDKDRYSAFFNTNLETILKDHQIENLIITGIASNVCSESTARDAFFRDYHVFFLSDCNAALDEEQHESALRNIRLCFGWVMDADEITKALE
jgi:ureidoacrylate peracid hydrolase